MSTPERPWWLTVETCRSAMTASTFPVALRPSLDAGDRARLDEPGCTDATARVLARRAQQDALRKEDKVATAARRAVYRERQAALLAAMTPEQLAERETKLAARRERDRARRAERDKEIRRWLRGGMSRSNLAAAPEVPVDRSYQMAAVAAAARDHREIPLRAEIAIDVGAE